MRISLLTTVWVIAPSGLGSHSSPPNSQVFWPGPLWIQAAGARCQLSMWPVPPHLAVLWQSGFHIISSRQHLGSQTYCDPALNILKLSSTPNNSVRKIPLTPGWPSPQRIGQHQCLALTPVLRESSCGMQCGCWLVQSSSRAVHTMTQLWGPVSALVHLNPFLSCILKLSTCSPR